ncbi:CopG family transcriptional regulator [Chakrabartyella piscis]|uniref:CopG family transcriptional regulator n=1 Tax=Chakrabartyella piscis TaxID=2918914 RepID=UPI002958C6A1|nr:CopG family transcriptional regulator [Chakrabartyella piscis]
MAKSKLVITQKPPKGEDGHTTFSIRIKTDLVEKIEGITKQTGHSRNELIGLLLEYAVDNSEVVTREEDK